MRRGASTWPAASVASRSTSSAGHARSGFTWSAVTGETPPQSSMPASSSGRQIVGEVRRRLHVDLGRQHQTGRRRWPTAGPRPGTGSALAMAVPGLGRKFWTMTSWTWPWRACDAAMARSVASWPTRSSPMPTRIPVVKGIASSPAASSVARRRAGALSGAPRCAARPSASDSSIIPWLAVTGRSVASSRDVERPGVGVRQQTGLLDHEAAHRGEVVDRRARSPCAASQSRRDGVAQLGPLAEREEGLVAAGAAPGLGRSRAPPRARGTGTSSRAGALAKVQ